MSRAGSSGSDPRSLKRAGYFQRAEAPLTSLLFLLPLIVIYELGTRYISYSTHTGEQRIIAYSLLQQFFALFGATGRYLPALAVVGILMTWHIARHDPWEARWGNGSRNASRELRPSPAIDPDGICRGAILVTQCESNCPGQFDRAVDWSGGFTRSLSSV